MSFSTILKSEIDSLAIGTFDGFHRGHRELFSNLSNSGAVLIIEKEYQTYLLPKRFKHLFTDLPILYYKLSEIEDLSGKEFIDLLQRTFPKLKRVVVGYDFLFGKGRSSSVENLKTLFSGEVTVVDEVVYNGISVHSKEIRKRLESGDIKSANRLLNRNFSIIGKQIKGQGIGAKSLFPTINLDISDFSLPKSGVYRSFTKLNGIRYRSITFLGHRLTTDGKLSLETHLLQEFQDDYNRASVEIEFLDYIRENRTFDSLKSLKEAIQKDIAVARSDF